MCVRPNDSPPRPKPPENSGNPLILSSNPTFPVSVEEQPSTSASKRATVGPLRSNFLPNFAGKTAQSLGLMMRTPILVKQQRPSETGVRVEQTVVKADRLRKEVVQKRISDEDASRIVGKYQVRFRNYLTR